MYKAECEIVKSLLATGCPWISLQTGNALKLLSAVADEAGLTSLFVCG